MHTIQLLEIRHSAAEKLAKETLRVETHAEYLGEKYPCVIYVRAYPRVDDGNFDTYTFQCKSWKASMRRLSRLYASLGGRALPPWTGVLVDGQEIDGNRKEEE
jgi:hypothetical protein